MKNLPCALFWCGLALASTFANVSCLAVTAALQNSSAAPRIVAIGDVHGAYDALLQLLRETDLVSAEGDWLGGNSQLVSLGDLLDRGPQVRQVLELFLKLERQAKAVGGGVFRVMGNHELMVMTNDLRYVSAADYAAYRTTESVQERDRSFQHYRKIHPGNNELATRAEFARAFPPGFNGLVDAFSQQGRYGPWLSQAPLILKMGDTLFLHGGLSKLLDNKRLIDINQRGHDDLHAYLTVARELRQQGLLPWIIPNWERVASLQRQLLHWRKNSFIKSKHQPAWLALAQRFVRLDQSFLFSPDSPLWYRGSALCNPNSEAVILENLLKQFDATRAVVGHTPTRNRRVTSRMNGQLIMLDTGMLESVYHGQPAALIMQNGSMMVHYLGHDTVTAVEQEQARMLAQPQALTDADLESLMISTPLTADDLAAATDPSDNDDNQLIKLEHNGTNLRVQASISNGRATLTQPDKANGGRKGAPSDILYNVAAYRLDRLLGFELVPVAVVRTLGENQAVLQYHIEDTFSEAERIRENIPIDGYCNLEAQQQLSRVFNILSNNPAAPQRSPRYTRNNKLAWLTDFRNAFGSRFRAGSALEDPPQLSALLRRKLAALTQKELQGVLSDVLNAAQIEEILTRRNLLLQADATMESATSS